MSFCTQILSCCCSCFSPKEEEKNLLPVIMHSPPPVQMTRNTQDEIRLEDVTLTRSNVNSILPFSIYTATSLYLNSTAISPDVFPLLKKKFTHLKIASFDVVPFGQEPTLLATQLQTLIKKK